MLTKWRFRCYPTPEQAKSLSRTFGCCRFVYNHFLRLRTNAYRHGEQTVRYAETDRLLTALKKTTECTWLNEVSSVPLQQSLRHLQAAFVNFFEKRSSYPSFKKKLGRQSATYTRSGFRWDGPNRRLLVAKIGRLKVRWSRKVSVEPSSVTITHTPSGRYFVAMTLDIPAPSPLSKSKSVIGVDLGLSRLATLSTGERVTNPQYLGKRLKRLARLQRVLSRRVKGSRRWHRQRKRLARLQEHIADARKDTLDKLTTRLVREHGTIVIEDLNVRGMVKNHSLARSLNDASLGTFRRMVTYKAAGAGRTLVVADRFFPSSKLCHACGHRLDSLPLSCREWNCPSCKAHHDRDDNAARNLQNLGAGHALSARGGVVSRPEAKVSERKPRRTVNQPKTYGS
jgi:putative transposase